MTPFFIACFKHNAGTLDNSEKQWILERQQKINCLNVTIGRSQHTNEIMSLYSQ